MIRRIVLTAVFVMAIPLAVGQSASGAKCQTWNAWSEPQHHRVGQLDVVGGHGYGSGYHSGGYKSPPQPKGAYGDPQRRAAQGGYIQYANGKFVVHVNLFGPLDENDTSHVYDTAFGACFSYGNRKVGGGEFCVPTSTLRKPAAWGPWTPCGGY